MKKLDSRLIAIAAFVASGLIVGAVGYFMLVAPQRSKAAAVATEIANAQTELIVAQGANARPVPFRASDLFRLAKAMPDGNDMPGIVLDLRRVAALSSVQLTSIRPAPLVPLALGYSALPVSVTVDGRYQDISSFLGRLRNDVRFDRSRLDVAGRLFVADSVQLSADAKGGTLSATFALNAFVYGGPPPLTATAGAGTAGATTTSTTSKTTTTPAPGATAAPGAATGSGN